jgi:NAD(P)-dependent dehydrogenase (short-subunit alcohol dehydrogenase family)
MTSTRPLQGQKAIVTGANSGFGRAVDKRIGEPEDIGRAAIFLASDESDYITGTSMYVDGGMTLYPEFASGG